MFISIEFIQAPSLKINFSRIEKRINPPFCLALVVIIIIIDESLEIMTHTMINKYKHMYLWNLFELHLS